MLVKDLIAELQKLPKEAEVFVACEGYNNYDCLTGSHGEDDETRIAIVDGSIFIADVCHISKYWHAEEDY